MPLQTPDRILNKSIAFSTSPMAGYTSQRLEVYSWELTMNTTKKMWPHRRKHLVPTLTFPPTTEVRLPKPCCRYKRCPKTLGLAFLPIFNTLEKFTSQMSSWWPRKKIMPDNSKSLGCETGAVLTGACEVSKTVYSTVCTPLHPVKQPSSEHFPDPERNWVHIPGDLSH